MSDARTNLSADVAAEVRRHLGDAVFDDRDPAERSALRGAQPRPADQPLRRRLPRRASRTPSSLDEFRARAGRGRPRRGPIPTGPARSRSDGVVMTVRPERTQGLGRGLAALIPQRAPGQPGADRHRRRPDPAQPVPAAPAFRRRPSSRRSRRASREHGVLQPILVTESRRRLRARRRRAAPASGASRPASSGSRRSSASSTTARSSSSR